MAGDKLTQETPTDDIDLINMLERIYLFLRRSGNAFLIGIVAGAILGCVVYFTSSKVYESKIILHSSYLTNQEELEIVDYWNQLLRRHQYKILADIFSCREELLNKVESLEAAQIQKGSSATDPNGFYVTARIRENALLPELQTAILNGLDNTDYVKEKILEKKQGLDELIDKATSDVVRMDSIKSTIENLITRNDKNSAYLLLNLGSLTKGVAELNEKIVGYKTDLNTMTAVQVLQGFIPLDTAVSRSLRTTILMGILLGLVVAYIFSLLKYIEERLKKRVKANA